MNLSVAVGWCRGTQVDNRQGNGDAVVHDLTRLAVHHVDGRAQHFVSSHQLIERALQSLDIERANQANGIGFVVT